MKAKLAALFLDWWNNFLTVERFAEYYRLEVPQARRVIRLGRILHEKGVAAYREAQLRAASPHHAHEDWAELDLESNYA